MNIDIKKGICPDFGRIFLDGCRDYQYELPLVDPYMNFTPYQLQDLPCYILVLICLGFIIHLIESACTSLLLTNLDPLLCKNFKGISDIHMRLEAIICE